MRRGEKERKKKSKTIDDDGRRKEEKKNKRGMKKNKIDASQVEWTVDRGRDEKYMDTQLLLHKKVTRSLLRPWSVLWMTRMQLLLPVTGEG